jgi:hypothetical protein
VRSARLIRWGVAVAVVVVLLVGAVALVQSFLGPVLGYRCDEPAKALASMHSIGDLRARFNDGASSPRLVLLLSPT